MFRTDKIFSIFFVIKHSINTSMMKTFIVPHLPHLSQYYTLFFKVYLHVNNKDTPKKIKTYTSIFELIFTD